MTKAPTEKMPPVARTSAGLRDILFDEIDAMRNGSSNPTRGNAVAKLVSGVIESVHMDLEVAKFAGTVAAQVSATAGPASLPPALQLGGA